MLLTGSCLWVIIVLVEVFLLPSFNVINLITLSLIDGNLLSALIMLPFILAAIRLDLMAPVSKKITRFSPFFFFLAAAVLSLYILLDSPFDNVNPQPVFINEYISAEIGSQNIVIESPAPACARNQRKAA